MTVLKLTIKDQKVGGGPIPGNLHPFPKIVEIILPLIYPAHKNQPHHISGPLAFWDGPHSCLWSVFLPRQFSSVAMDHILSMERVSVYWVCISLNKSTSYLSLCLSLNSLCHKTSRTWASWSPETRYVISIKRHGFKSQSGFWPGSSPGTWVQILI